MTDEELQDLERYWSRHCGTAGEDARKLLREVRRLQVFERRWEWISVYSNSVELIDQLAFAEIGFAAFTEAVDAEIAKGGA